MYEKTIWKDEVVSHPHRYEKTDNLDGTIELERSPGTTHQAGTPLDAKNMNNIEDGTADNALASSIVMQALRLEFKRFRDNISSLFVAVGGPSVAATATAMTDTTKIYVYTGSETGYSYGHWYYYDDEWTDGGVYNSNTVSIDDTLTQSGEAADAKAVGDALADTEIEFYDALSDGNVVITKGGSQS